MEINLIILLVLLSFSAFIQYNIYGSKIILHPSLWFYIIWIFSIISFFIVTGVIGFDVIIMYPDLIVQLLVYVTFTGFCFNIVGYLSRRTINKINLIWSPKLKMKTFRLLVLILLGATLVKFFSSAGFDITANRAAHIEQSRAYAIEGQSLPFHIILLNLLLMTNLPLLIVSGFALAQELDQKDVGLFKIKKIFFVPFLIEVLNTISMGGRAGIIYAFIFFSIGFNMYLFRQQTDKRKVIVKAARYVLIFFIAFSVYSTYVNIMRSENAGKSYTMWDKTPLLKPFSGIIKYLTDHYPGYQLRMKDSITPELEMGESSLSAITNYEVPGLGRLVGDRVSIASIFGLKQVVGVKSSVRLVEEGRGWAATTATIYLPLYQDFGYYGTFIAIFVMVSLTQLVFNKISKIKNIHSVMFFLLVIIIYFWARTIFTRALTGNWLNNLIYPFASYYIINRMLSKK